MAGPPPGDGAQKAPDGPPTGATGSNERAKSRELASLRGLIPFLLPYRKRIIAVVVALVLAAGFTLMVPVAFGRVIDVINAKAFELIDEYFIALMGVAAALAIATALRFYLISWLGERVIADIRSAVFDHVVVMSPAFYERIMTAEVLTRLTSDTAIIQTVVGSTVSIALRNILILIGGIIALLITSPKLTAMTLLIVPAVVFPILILGRRVRRLSRESQDRLADAASQAGEMLQAAQTVQANTFETAAKQAFGQRVEQAFDAARRRLVARSWLTVLVIFFVFAGVVGVIWIGARDVISGAMSPGEMAQFVLFAVFTAGAVGALSEVWGELQRAAGAMERLAELLAMTSPVAEPEKPEALTAPEGKITFEELSFSYPSRPDTAAIHRLSFDVAPGETIALVGPSGAGKTTVLQLLARFYDPDEGRITLDGQPIQDLALRDLRSRLASVPQEPVIFADSVRANIRFGRPSATDAEVEAAAKAAAAHDFVMALPGGYEAWLGERGILLSGGQKQRIAIARAILRDAPVLLLDEATSALDAESERAVQEAVERLSEGRTTLVIAHRLATVKRADRIIVLDGGRIVATGRHDDLVAQGGLYARLARLQFTEGLAAE
ncbi:MAG: ABC transporter transmembrane domain-containing protein [Pseudomonadota bacterium]